VRRLHIAVAVAATVALGLAACSSPSKNAGGGGASGGTVEAKHGVTDPTAKGPAPEIPGAKKGGTVTVYSQSTPDTFDPTDIYYTDGQEIGRLLFRTPTQIAIRDNQSVLIPDLTDLGKASSDNLTWTFKLQPGIKYADGTDIKVEDLAYAIKRSFAHDVFINGPTYQLQYFKDGDKYKGPYTSGDNYSGVETPDANTLVIHLAKPFPDLPFYMSFDMFTPIPKAKDTKDQYKNNPLATGPYQFDAYTPGAELKLKRNPNWDPKTDALRHAYPDAWDFKWGTDDVKTQQQVLNSNGPDANAFNYGNLDASLVPQVSGPKANQLVKGPAPCTIVVNLDSRKIPLEVRKAIATAFPYNADFTAAGLNDYVATPASSVLPPGEPGYVQFPKYPGLGGPGKGDPAAAKQMLQAAGKTGFELSWYYDNTKTVPQQVNQVRVQAFQAAGFTVKPIGVSTAELRKKTRDYNAPVNMDQAPRGWCHDWPSGTTWFPVLFEKHSIDDGQSWGFLNDGALDAQIDQIASLPVEEASKKWGDIDKQLTGMYLFVPRYYNKTANVIGSNIGGAIDDVSLGQILNTQIYLKSGS
jgi:peptide/nickel transport system substrate-binding protein